MDFVEDDSRAVEGSVLSNPSSFDSVIMRQTTQGMQLLRVLSISKKDKDLLLKARNKPSMSFSASKTEIKAIKRLLRLLQNLKVSAFSATGNLIDLTLILNDCKKKF